MPTPPEGPLTPELAQARFTSRRDRARRVQAAWASGARMIGWGATLLALFALGAWAAPPEWWSAALAAGLAGGLLGGFGLVRVAAAFALSRRPSP